MDLKVPDNQLLHARPVAHGRSQSVSRQDDELPPSARTRDASNRSISHRAAANSTRLGWIAGLFAAATVAAIIAFNPLGQPSDHESNSQNWKHVAAANQGNQAMNWIAADGAAMLTDQVLVSNEDQDTSTTEAVRQALMRGDEAAADAIFAAAQSLPMRMTSLVSSLVPQVGSDAISEGSTQPIVSSATPGLAPTLTPGLRAEIAKGDTSFYHIHLSDSCFDDGDVVEILVNGQPLFMVPITNAGATLSVPIPSNTGTVIAIRGIYDGGGGITVACRTSQGEGFVRVMEVGEILPLGVVIR